jgi:sugar/nucleoside kinase (ribokinase family)
LFSSSLWFLVRLVPGPQKKAILHAVNLAKRYNLKMVFDPCAHNLVKSDFKLFKRLLDVCDVFCPNLEEAKAITRTNQLEITIERLQSEERLTAIKFGKDGCILINKKEIIKVPGFKAKCVDSTGAGDAFASALIFGLANNFPLKNVGQLANWFASQVTTQIGARNFPSKTEIRSFLKELKTAEK